MSQRHTEHDQKQRPRLHGSGPEGLGQLVSVESQREFDVLTGEWAERVFVKLYVAARTSGLLAAISDRDWKTLCTLATYMDGEGFCYPSQAELAAAMGCSRQMANERIRSLAEFRFQERPVLVIVKGERTESGKWSGNGYRVLSLSSLRIYDGADEAGILGNDTGTDSASTPGSTVSSFLDTVGTDEATVSSPTVTVQLDTNKNHSLEQEKSFEIRKGTRQKSPKNGRAADRETGEPTARETGRHLQGSGNSDDEANRTDPVVPEGYRQLKEQVNQLRRRRERTGRRPERKRGSAGEDGPQPIGTLLKGTHTAIEPTAEDGSEPPRGRPPGAADEREQLRAYLADFAKELHDGAPLSATITRVLRLFREVGVPRERWGDLLYQARAITQEHSAQITTPAGEGSLRGTKNKMPYYLAVLEDLLGLKLAPEEASDISLSVPQTAPVGNQQRSGRSG